jgi:hypothetical protein
VKTIEAFHTYGTPPVDPRTGLVESEAEAIAAQE